MKMFAVDGTPTTLEEDDGVYVKICRQDEEHMIVFIGCVVCVNYTDDDDESSYAPAVIVAFTTGDDMYVRYLHDDDTAHRRKRRKRLTVKHIVRHEDIVCRLDTMSRAQTKQYMPAYIRQLHVYMRGFQDEFFSDGYLGVLSSLDLHAVSNDEIMDCFYGRHMTRLFHSIGLFSFGAHDRFDIGTPILKQAVVTTTRLTRTVVAKCDACHCSRSLTWSMDMDDHLRGRVGNECVRKVSTLQKMADCFDCFETVHTQGTLSWP